MGAAGSATSPASHTLLVVVLAVAVLYVAWRSAQMQQELRGLRALVDASVSLHELEEQVMPAIDGLEMEAARLKREVQELARRAASAPRTHARGGSVCAKPSEAKESERGSDSEEEASDGDIPPRASVEGSGFFSPGGKDYALEGLCGLSDLSMSGGELSLLMGMQTLMGAACAPQVSAVGVPTARVIIGGTLDACGAGAFHRPSVVCEEESDSDVEEGSPTEKTLGGTGSVFPAGVRTAKVLAAPTDGRQRMR